MEWRSGRTPRIEAYLESVKPGQRERLLRELLAVEVELRIAQGDNPTPTQLRLKYPDWGHAITVALEQGRRRRRPRREGCRPACAADEADTRGVTQRICPRVLIGRT